MRTVSTFIGLTLLALTATAQAQQAAPPAPAVPATGAPASAANPAVPATPAPEAAAAPVAPPPAEPMPVAPPPAAPAPTEPAMTASAMPAGEAPSESRRKLQVALTFLPMGMGKYIQSPDTVSVVKADAAFAYGFGVSAGYEVLPGLVLGVAPQIILNVKEKDPAVDYAAQKQIDFMARIAYVLSLGEGTSFYAELLPGYSFIQNDSTPKGVVVAAGVGAIMDMTDRVFVSLGGGYQIGFQNWQEGANTFQTRTRYIRVALSGGVRF